MKTVGGEAALSFDPLDIEAMAQAIESVFNDDTLHRNMIRKGKAHAAAMTWTRAAEETLRVYQTIG
jgi:glycosyltransferase involved in cell wall biosynthesis